MTNRPRFLLFVLAASIGTLAVDGPFTPTHRAAAQGFGRGSRDGGGESREERRERWRRGMSGDRGGEGERRSDGRSGGSSSSSGGSGGGSSSSTSSSGTSESKSTSSSSGASAPSMSTSDYAKGLVKQFDKNGDHMLQADERKELRGRAAEADLDKDGVITIDELVTHLASTTPPAVAASSSTASSSESSSGGGGDSGRRDRDGDRRRGDSDGGNGKRVFTGSAGGIVAKEGDKRRTYRFSTAADRLPKNLPSFFSRDTNGDGQVSMSEYSRTWSKSTVAEFRKYDLNDDGIITAKEAVKPASSGG